MPQNHETSIATDLAGDLGSALATVNELLTHGSVQQAHALLTKLLERKIDRRYLATAANLARRMHLPERAVALLHRRVYSRSDRNLGTSATIDETAEYAVALGAIGGTAEALQLLLTIDPAKHPLSLLYRGYARAWRWDWDGAITDLDRFARMEGVSPEIHHWGSLELARCLMHGRGDLKSSRECMTEVASQSGPDHFRMLHKNALLGLLEAAALSEEWSECDGISKRIANAFLDDEDPVFNLVFDQWRCLARLQASPRDPSALQELRAVRERCRSMRRWENMRACDYYEAALFHNEKLLLQLFFGTPYRPFRQRVLALLGGTGKLPESFEWNFFRRPERDRTLIDVSNGENTKSPAFLKERQVPQKLFEILGTDFYRPIPITEIHERLFPGERFNPRSSPNRVYQAVSRLRQWLTDGGLGLKIEESAGCYSLSAEPGFAIAVPLRAVWRPSTTTGSPSAAFRRRFALLSQSLGKQRFRAAEALACLNTSYTSTMRILNEAVKHGLVRREGLGRRTHYSLLSKDVSIGGDVFMPENVCI